MITKHLLGVLTIACSILVLYGKKEMEIGKLKCVIKHNKLKSLGCYITSSKTLTLNFTTPDEDFQDLVGVAVLKFAQPGRPNLLRYDHMRFELCNFLSIKLRKNNPLHNIYRNMRKVAINFPKKCPFKKNTVYTLKDFNLDFDMIPDFVPEWKFNFEATFNTNGMPFLYMDLGGGICNLNHSCINAKKN